MPDPRVELRLTARDQTAAAFQSVRRGLGSLNTQIASVRSAALRLGPAFAAIGAGVSVAAFSRLVKSGIDAADQLGVVSKRTGVAVEDLSALKFAAEQSETNFETLTTGLQRFELNLAKAGISGQNTIGVLTALADRVKQTEDPAKRLQIAFAAFGRGVGPELVPFLALGGEGINALIQKIRDMGGIITGPMAAASDDFNDQLSAIKTQLTAAGAILGGGFLKGLGDLSDLRLDGRLRDDIEAVGHALGEAARFAVEFGDKIAIAIATVAGFAAAGPLGGVLSGLTAAAVVGEETVERLGISAKGFTSDAAQLKDRIGELQGKVKDYRGELEKLGAGDPSGQRLGIEKGIANAEIAIGRLQGRLKELGGTGGEVPPGTVDQFLSKVSPAKAAKKGGGAGAALNDVKALIEASLAATQDALDREQRSLDQALEDELVSFRDFYARRTAIAVAGIDAEIAAKREALAQAKDQGDVARITSEITVLERKRGDIAVQARRDQAQAERELADELTELRARVLEAEGRGAEAAGLRLEQEFRERIARFQIEGSQAGIDLAKRVFNIEQARAQLTQLQAEFDRVREQLAREETRVNVQVDTGLQGELAGRREIVRLHTETAAKLAPIVDQMRVIAQTIGPEEISRVAGLASEIDVLGTVTNEVAQSLNNEFKNAAASAFTDFLTGAKSAEQAFADFGKSILDAVAQIAAQNIAEELFGDFFKTAKKGAGGGGFFDLLGSLFHQGGIVGLPGPGRRVPALAFAGAPRLHDGGMLGLRRDEVPAILQRGEEVLTRGDPRHQANQGAGDVTVIMNITTPDVQGFRRSSGQIAVEASTAIGRASRNRP
jgi:hypothetical protein